MSDCSLTGTFGVIVQMILALMVLIVLVLEWAFELCQSNSGGINDNHSHKVRSLHSWWFDTYKICAGAMISHCFNVFVSLLIEKITNGSADECALYCLAFYYEACGVPFVQLLQYGVIEYSRRMSKIRLDGRNHSRDPAVEPVMSEECKERWKYISEPGVYSPLSDKYPIKQCLRAEDLCGPRRVQYLNLFSIVIFAAAISLALTAALYSFDPELYLVLATPICLFILITTSWFAPDESIWQVLAWISVKSVEKSIWSVFAVSQARSFASWSQSMQLSDAHLDGVIYIAVVPIILNAFMFFMFSRISRLQIPCMPLSYNESLDHKLDLAQRHQQLALAMESNPNGYHNHHYNQVDSDPFQSSLLDVSGSASVSKSNGGDAAVLISKNHDSNDSTDELIVVAAAAKNAIDADPNSVKRGTLNDSLSHTIDTRDVNLDANAGRLGPFDKREAFKVGVVSMLIINGVLFLFAATLLICKGVTFGVLLLAATMLGAPLICSVIAIYAFAYLVDNRIVICHCCQTCAD